MNFVTSAGVMVLLSAPISSQRLMTAGSFSTACISVARRSTIGCGVFAGTGAQVWVQAQGVIITAVLSAVVAFIAFKIVDLPNIMTSGGPGIATESMTLHSYFLWRANDMGSSAAVAYLLLILTVVTCASFFNYVVVGQLRKAKAA